MIGYFWLLFGTHVAMLVIGFMQGVHYERRDD